MLAISFEIGAHRAGSYRQRKCVDHADAWLRRVPGSCGARLFNGLANGDWRATRSRLDLAMGLATVSISAAVSPKFLLNWMGPAPRGRLHLVHPFQVDVAEFFLLVLDGVVELNIDQRESGKADRANAEVRRAGGLEMAFCVVACSIGRVTSCSTCSAVAPGHGIAPAATRTGMSGSLRLGMFW